MSSMMSLQMALKLITFTFFWFNQLLALQNDSAMLYVSKANLSVLWKIKIVVESFPGYACFCVSVNTWKLILFTLKLASYFSLKCSAMTISFWFISILIIKYLWSTIQNRLTQNICKSYLPFFDMIMQKSGFGVLRSWLCNTKII